MYFHAVGTAILSKQDLDQFKKSIVFLGRVTNEKLSPQATGFLVNINDIFHLVTAKHVIFDQEKDSFIDSDVLMFFNTLDGKIQQRSIEHIKKNLNLNWIFHQNRKVDIGIIPFGLDTISDDVKFVPNNFFLSADQLYEGYDVFFLSFQPGIEIEQRISPILRVGTISLMSGDNTFYIDAATFPGNSGSPVFLKPSLMYQGAKISTVGGGRFIGLIGGYVPYQEVAFSSQTGRPRVVFEENTGLSKVWSASFINEIIDSDAFKEQVAKI
jgi:hypothetical protein